MAKREWGSLKSIADKVSLILQKHYLGWSSGDSLGKRLATIINPEMTHLSFHAFIYSFSHLIIRRLYLPGTGSLKYCFSFRCRGICENSQQLCTFFIEDMLRCSGVKWLASQSLLLKHFGLKFEMIEFATAVSSANQLTQAFQSSPIGTESNNTFQNL